MGDMPYTVDKGVGITLIARALNKASDSDLIAYVQALRGPGGPQVVRNFAEKIIHPGASEAVRLVTQDPPWWYTAPPPHLWDVTPPISMRQHFLDDWYVSPSTGWWTNLTADVEGIMAEGMARAVEIALGIDIPALGVVPEPIRRWPIDMWWTCGVSRFDVHLSWMQEPVGSPFVRFHVMTPSFGKNGIYLFEDLEHDPTNVMTDPRYRLDVAEARNFAVQPQLNGTATYSQAGDGKFLSHREGSWLVSAKDTEVEGPTPEQLQEALAELTTTEQIQYVVRVLDKTGVFSSIGSPLGHVAPVWNNVKLTGPVTSVSMALGSGGVFPK